MNKDWQFSAVERIDNFAEQLCGGQNDVALAEIHSAHFGSMGAVCCAPPQCASDCP